MTVKELIICLQLCPENAEVMIVHPEWPIRKVEFNDDKNLVELK